VTTFVSQRVSSTASAPRSPQFVHRVGSALSDWAHAFKAAANAPRRQGMDPIALLMFGRD
jgi:hypothetical protein